MSLHRAVRQRRTRPSVNVGLFLTMVMVCSSAVWAGVPTFSAAIPRHHVEVSG